METDRLISLLATGVTAVDPRVAARRFSWALIAGAIGSTLLVVLFYGVRPDLRDMLVTPLFWAKVALPVLLAAGALAVTARLARPGAAVGRALGGIVVPLAAVWIAAGLVLALAPAGERSALVLGQTWRSCPLNIAFLSIPGFIALFRAVAGLAPTRLRVAGAAAGLTAGATATVAYCLHCPEMAVPFWAVWYILGMLIPAALGALAGPRWLRW
ncbi:DUF1109 domain-containing protein [Trinickia caryophylli]|uniref:Anti-sigma-F factor NrsF n=1 Tax=Trinickia caryophylli TaxID=28094 RepID=A0A1X7F8W7_TRICW|nr:DUF1109 domain-containing protein [Trinickia caryophylli]PMS08899.1 DUF1109 domain-containing protein [Trinickia caryophylli]TRX18982.1 DUF1109 domain-containing protein [Trinickia caryophylli]WQE10220.1 DUF1109 domain-containing protein [Trinickia caryophylli]SMF48110.1 hypothetical protein SAMN06295900_10822 [Trinickia caryophylli]GLU34338.1 hypothetical protein Busp01_41800 [Trinickia caryophylli]